MQRIHLWFAAIFALDKVLHFSVSYFITSVALIFGVPFGIGIGLSAGVVKEVSDELFFNGWSWGDVIANILGIVSALIIHEIKRRTL